MNSSVVWHNANQYNSHGPLGQGVLYKFKFYNSEEKKFVAESSSFVSRGASTLGISTEYGNYMGATSLFKIANDGNGFTKEYDYSLPAVDAVDNFAKQHDIGYDKLNAVGANGLFDDWVTTPVDEAARNGWSNFLSKSKVGSADPYSGQSVTKSQRAAAKNALIVFDFVISNKKGSISYWMQRNYKGEAANHTNKGNHGKKDMDSNYALFLNKYMDKDKDGNSIRKKGMWTQDKGGNWNPNKPKKG